MHVSHGAFSMAPFGTPESETRSSTNFQRRADVADQRSLRLIGITFGAITVLVTIVAVTVVAGVGSGEDDQSLPVAASPMR